VINFLFFSGILTTIKTTRDKILITFHQQKVTWKKACSQQCL